MANYLKTATQPAIYYLPKKHNAKTEEILAVSKRQAAITSMDLEKRLALVPSKQREDENAASGSHETPTSAGKTGDGDIEMEGGDEGREREGDRMSEDEA